MTIRWLWASTSLRRSAVLLRLYNSPFLGEGSKRKIYFISTLMACSFFVQFNCVRINQYIIYTFTRGKCFIYLLLRVSKVLSDSNCGNPRVTLSLCVNRFLFPIIFLFFSVSVRVLSINYYYLLSCRSIVKWRPYDDDGALDKQSLGWAIRYIESHFRHINASNMSFQWPTKRDNVELTSPITMIYDIDGD